MWPLLLALSCSRLHLPGHDHDHDEGAGHDHDAAAEDPRPTLSRTLYQGELELFLEYPALVVGQPSPLVTHLTDTRDPNAFAGVGEGSVQVTLRREDGSEQQVQVAEPLRLGVFRPVLTPERAGRARLSIRLDGHPAGGTIELGEVLVHPTVAEAVAAGAGEEAADAGVPFLKEAQWTTTWATAPVERGLVREGVPATGELRAAAGAEVELGAPVAGRLLLDGPLYVGRAVRKGERLARILPLPEADRAALEAEREAAMAALELAERALDRARGLHPAVVSERELREAEAAQAAARARAESARSRGAIVRAAQAGEAGGEAGAAFALRAPFDGVVDRAEVREGMSLAAGAMVARLLDPREVWLHLRVAATDAARVGTPAGARLRLADAMEEIDIASRGGRLVAVGAALDPVARTLPVIFALDNADGRLKPGMFVRATLYLGEGREGLVVPASAVVDQGGQPVVYVQAGGESFVRRRVRLGARDGERQLILSGLVEGERVVSQGAYELHLASATGAIPEHGHAH